ncbi:hypothetical protein CC77DRAFT_58418 [Alternaria alternata]|uniref:Uncharacterized protein n=1 Tax=Alternaria alternata TaxID=5599 RepID=A0A177E3P0_ALTAL|nr:hypothetical protein CC77DRAFT_58418 [Alternaria alternata]OAG26584.1 hypothetical protein CC77DRAFT_58418 [Alternaria alternata]
MFSIARKSDKVNGRHGALVTIDSLSIHQNIKAKQRITTASKATESNSGYQVHKRSQTIPTQSYFQPHNKRRDGHHDEHVYPFTTDPKSPNLNISRAQKSEAWGRIRAVSELSGYPASTHKWQDGGEKRAKKVRWGVIQTHRFESETAADDRDTANQHDP